MTEATVERVRTPAPIAAAIDPNSAVRRRILAAYVQKDKKTLARIPARYGRRHPAEESHFALARLCEETGDSAGAELAPADATCPPAAASCSFM